MMEEDQYRTLSEQSESLFKDRGSKFYGYVFPCRSEDEFKDKLDEIKKLHHQARHHCYAWRINPDDLQFRANDDGEPAHSAGTPILHALQSVEVVNVGAIVVRYFGGTKLGVSGLINAYRTAAAEALEVGVIITKQLEHGGWLTTDYEHMSQVLHILDKLNATIEEQILEYDCKYKISFRRSHLEMLQSFIEPIENINFVRNY